MRRSPLLVLVSTSALLLGLTFTLAATRAPQKRAAKKATPTGYGDADAISLDELKDYDYFLASDQIEGRNLPSRGYDVAALYVASHLAEWGLQPGGSTSGTNGPLQPYLMPIDLVTSQPNPAGMQLTITIPESRAGGRGGRGGFGAPQLTPGPHELAYGHAWMVSAPAGRNAPPLRGADIAHAGIVFAGNGYVIGSTNPYQNLEVAGKVVVVAGLPPALAAYQAAAAAARGGRGAGPAPVNPIGPADLTPQQYAAQHGALALITIPTFNQLAAMDAPDAAELKFGPNGPNYAVAAFMSAAPATATVPEITAGLDTVAALFQGERVNAAAVFAAASANSPLPSFALTPEKTITATIAVNTVHNHGENVIAMLPGSDPVLKNEYVVISAHLDHIGMSALPAGCVPNPVLAAGDSTDEGFPITAPDTCDNINNGADDDGSGSTGLLGIAHAYAQGAALGMRPKRTMIFLWNAGEEKGLWGSQYFNEFPPVDISKVVVDLNMDMIGRTKTPGYVDPPSYKLVAPHEVLVVGPDISSLDLEKTLEAVNDNYQKLALNHFYDDTVPDATHDNIGPGPQGQRIFYRSDHYNFAKMGIPIAFFSDGLHVDYHRPTDSPEKIDFVEIQQVSKTAAAVGWVIANEPAGATPKLNAQLPAQLVSDMAAVKAQGWGKLTPVLPPLPGEPF